MIVILVIFCGILLFSVLTRKYRNKYKMYLVFGKKGSGKSTFLIKQGIKYKKRGYNVYTNMVECCVDGFRLIDINDLGEFVPEENSILLVDEVGMIWDNRNFKNFKTSVRDFFKLQRHYKVVCFLASQTYDVDKKLRDLVDGMYLCCGLANVFSVAKRIARKVVLTESVGDQESRISENLKFTPFFTWVYTYIPRYAKCYDSFVVPQKPKLTYITLKSDLKDIVATTPPQAM